MEWVMLALGALELGYGIYQSIDQTNKQEAAMDKEKRRESPYEYSQSKQLVKELYTDLNTSKVYEEGLAADRDVSRRAVNANINLSPSARLQSDISSVITKGQEEMNIWNQYRTQKNAIVSQELNVLSESGRAAMAINEQNLALAREKQQLYNTRQAAWGELMNAGISNMAGSLQYSENKKMLKEAYDIGQDAVNKGKMSTDDYNALNQAVLYNDMDAVRKILARNGLLEVTHIYPGNKD